MKYCYIYALVDPREYKIRYIGKACNPNDRLNSHIAWAKEEFVKLKNHNYNWIRELLHLNLLPMLHVLDIVPEEDWQLAEQAWIFYGREEAGWDLTNATDGGEGGHGYVWSEDTKREWRVRMSGEGNPFYGRTHTNKSKLRMKEVKSGSNNPNYGKPRSEVTKRKIGDAQIGEKNHMHGKFGESNPHYGMKRSSEVCKNIAAGMNKERRSEVAKKGWITRRRNKSNTHE